MIDQKKILLKNKNLILTEDLIEYEIVESSLFPKLIYQEFLKRLKIPTIEIAISQSGEIIERYPGELELADETNIFENKVKASVNKMDLLTYYLLTCTLKSKFSLNAIFIENTKKTKLYFTSFMPFEHNITSNLPSIIKYLLKISKSSEISDTIDRFFILMNPQFRDKLLTFLTFLETKYNFKLDKKNFIEAALNQQILNESYQKLSKLLLK